MASGAGGDAGRETTAPLAGLRVVELWPGVAAGFAGRWLGGLGADVIKLEPPGGDPVRHAGPWPDGVPDPEASGRALYLDAGKRSARLDLSAPEAREPLTALLTRSDLLLMGRPRSALAEAGVDLAALRRRRPGLVCLTVTPFGESGPYVDLPATPLTLAALSGILWWVGDAGRPPLAQWGDQVEYLGGLHALGAALSGLFGARTSGAGGDVEVSLQACAAAIVGHNTSRSSQRGGDGPRSGGARALWRVYRAADGWAGVSALGRNYPRLAEAMGVPEINQASPFLDSASRQEAEQRLSDVLAGWFASRTRKEISELALSERIPLAPVLSVEEVANSRQLAHREFFMDDVHPRAGRLRMPAQLWSSPAHHWRRERAPELGADTDAVFAERAENPAPPAPSAAAAVRAAGLLDGVRVLDLGQIWAGPYAAMLLADQGADVVKVESPIAWDPNRVAMPPPGGMETDWWNASPFFHEYNHNKRSLGLDLRQERGREILGRLVAVSDVVIENLRSDVLDKLGIGYDWMCRQRSDVILVSMTAFGRTGPERVLPGYGPMIEMLSGIAGLTGYEEDDPHLTGGIAYGDPVAATAAASAALAALHQRLRTGRGQHVDLAQRDATTALVGEAFVAWSMSGRSPQPIGNARRGCAPHGVYPCRGVDQWVAIAVVEDAHWQGLRRVLGDPDWAVDPVLAGAEARCGRGAELDEALADWTRTRDKLEVFERCREAGVPAAPVWEVPELLRDPQLAARDFYEETSHADLGRWACHGWVWRPDGAGPCVRRKAPDFGGDNAEVLRELLGLGDAEIAALEAEGVVTTLPRGLPELPKPA